MNKMTIALNGDYDDIQAMLSAEYLEPLSDTERKFQERAWARYDAYYHEVGRHG